MTEDDKKSLAAEAAMLKALADLGSPLGDACLHCVLVGAGNAWAKAQTPEPPHISTVAIQWVRGITDLLSVVTDPAYRAHMLAEVIQQLPRELEIAVNRRAFAAPSQTAHAAHH